MTVSSQDVMFSDFCLSEAHTGFVVVEIGSGRVLASVNGDKLFAPASNTKLFTTAYALLRLGENFRWGTPVTGYGKIKRNGFFKGTLVVSGNGDPTFSSVTHKHFCPVSDHIVTLLLRNAITRMKGNIAFGVTARCTHTVPSNWLLDDVNKPWGAGVHTINFNNNVRWFFRDTPGVEVWDTAGISREVSTVINLDPEGTLAGYLKFALQNRGIPFQERPWSALPKTMVFTDTVFSVGLGEIIQEINFYSRNMWAEALLLRAALHTSLCPDFDAASDSLSAYWRQQLGLPGGVYFYDGSGLSPYNAVTPMAVVQLLNTMAATHFSGLFTASLPLAGHEGTVKDMEIVLPDGRFVRMKSGSFTRVICYSGYVFSSDDAPLYAFSFMVNGYRGSQKEVKNAIAHLLSGFFQSME
ncbi:MAG: D-alanyl-D-alanine carboxypeptidase [Bacteroidales bacterium]|nr:D-alanyl-D-alanine carboxypeptidase [Bacteroidales bacterium]MDD2323885.1 D-alanyl-D-alanine carboxypeptidase [Bacteroidales bacterium]MDD3011475.1 D-alanyl-D-alanine carboxypeptidase [Bacteroidales bacterium]MDY0286155.1 D-alanyl-D-alanine carboxypeptidase [Bacteroidales bacterium]HPE87856.1 D-alanyl-D-alanine carboxypeptidase [Bacteroidales bacterium]